MTKHIALRKLQTSKFVASFLSMYITLSTLQKKLQVSPVNKRYIAIDIHALIPLNQKNQPCISLSQSVTSKQSKMYITLCILRYRPESAHFSKPSIHVQTFFTRLPFTTWVSSMIWRSKFGKNPTYFIILYKLHSCIKYILVCYVIVLILFKFALACLGLPGRPFKLPFENAFAG